MEEFEKNPLANSRIVDIYNNKFNIGSKLVKVLESYFSMERTVILAYDDEDESEILVLVYGSTDRLREYQKFDRYSKAKEFFLDCISNY